MFSIKQSFANCSTCPLLDCNSCILETNCEDDLSKVDLVIVAENPGKDEIIKEIPLIGKAGKTFREFFYKYKINELNYLITNTVLCQTLNKDGSTGNPTDDVIEECKKNCFSIIDACKPKLILLMGSSPMKAFGIAKDSVTQLRGNLFKWKNYDVLLTVHPQFVNYNRNTYTEKFESDIAKINKILGVDSVDYVETDKDKPIKSGLYHYTIPDKFYTDDYRLIDIQYIPRSGEVLYIFRDKENKKVFHKTSDDYYYYKPKNKIADRKIVPYEDLNCYMTKYKLRNTLDPENTYEGDIRLTVKHAQDYYIHNKDDAPEIDPNILFFDIEVYTGKSKEFPSPQKAKYPINMITSIYHNKTTVFVLDNKKEKVDEVENIELRIFRTEKDLMDSFIKYFRECDPDYCTGWNSTAFDFNYIYNRCSKLFINSDSLSRFGEVYVDGAKYICNIPGTVPLDMDFLYKSFTFEKREMYKLGFIAQLELGVTKIDVNEDGGLNKLYEENINKLVKYNIRDTELLVKLNDKLKHISLLNEIRKICCSSFDGSTSPMSRLDSLITNFLKNKGYASKNADPHKTDSRFEGAYVREPIPGIHDWIVDFDFTSLYPSIIQTYNIGLNSFKYKLKDYKMGYDFCYDHDSLPDEIILIEDPIFSKKERKYKKEELIKKISDENLIWTITGCFFERHNNELSYYAEILKDLLSSRKVYKNKMFEASNKGNKFEESMFDNKQNVYKILANSLYGILGNSAFRFFNIDLARSITLSGQEAIKFCILYGNSYVDKIYKNSEFKDPDMISKKEMYEGLINRNTKNVITGDTDSLFVTYENLKLIKGEEEKYIEKYNKEIQDFLNQHIQSIVINKHNGDSNTNKLELKNELVIRRGLYLQKKRYANYILYREGNPVNKIKAMGLETKRSDFPSYTKELLDKLLSMILKSEKLSLIKIQDFVKNTEIDILSKVKAGDKVIARPVHWVKKLSEYKTVPQGVKAMVNWNKLMYDCHNVGSKAYMFKIQGVKLEKAPDDFVQKYDKEFLANGIKLEAIAIPDEESKLPEWIVPDLKLMLKFCWQDRYKLLMEPLIQIEDEILTI